jgi:hypothetical protein
MAEAMFREHVEAIRLFPVANAPLPEGRKSTIDPGACSTRRLEHAHRERFREGCLARVREHVSALGNMRDRSGLDSDPVALRDEEAKVARINRALQQLRTLREIEESRKQRAELGAAELQGGDSSGEIGIVHGLESAKPAGRNPLAGGIK